MINYYLLTKPGIIFGNLFTVAAGFILGTKGHFDVLIFLSTVLGLGAIIASACIFNNAIDLPQDKMMNRTKHRPLVLKAISLPNALAFGTVLGVLGIVVLSVFTNFLAVAIAAIGFFVYVILYSFWKCRTVYGTAIGSIAGALPPVIGYCAASGQFDKAAIILFAMMILWQMPHFFAIALVHFEDYKRAGIPVLPVSKGILRTKTHMFLYIAAFTLTATLLTYFNYTGYAFLFIALAASFSWLLLCALGFYASNPKVWGKKMFRLSLAVIAAICISIPFDKV